MRLSVRRRWEMVCAVMMFISFLSSFFPIGVEERAKMGQKGCMLTGLVFFLL